MTNQKQCACGAWFKRSRADTTVRCPACRAKRKTTLPRIRPAVICNCGKTVLVDSFGAPASRSCPRGC